MRRSLDTVNAVVVVLVVSLSLYFLLTYAAREEEPERGIKGGEAGTDPRSVTGGTPHAM